MKPKGKDAHRFMETRAAMDANCVETGFQGGENRIARSLNTVVL
jgi:hypothetical protein